MKTVGIIAEYNPFHNGHKYLIEKARAETNADNVIILSSGNFVQRGEPAIFDKYTRSEVAINNGADVVFELPVVYSTASAELFAYASVKFMDDLNVVDYLCFGCELNDIDSLSKIAEVLTNEPIEYKEALLKHSKAGLSFPKARSLSLCDYFKKSNINIDAEAILSTPNNILAIEYLKALKKLNSNIIPMPIKRIGGGYSSTEINCEYVSATAIRNQISNNNSYENLLESDIFNFYKDKRPIFMSDFNQILSYRLSRCNLEDIFDINEDLANRILNNISSYTNIDKFISQLQSKNYTYSAISRAMIHVLLGIKSKDINEFKENGCHFYARILALSSESNILSQIKKNGDLELISKFSTYYQQASGLRRKMLDISLNADMLYQQIYMTKYNHIIPNEFNEQIRKI